MTTVREDNFITNNSVSLTWAGPDSNYTAIALVAHGLNLNPDKMDPLILFLTEMNIRVLKVGLTGHNGDLENQENLSRSQWIYDITQGMKQLSREEVPLYFIGFSLGALVVLDYISTEKHNPFSKMVLFAPAITPHGFTKSVLLLSFLGKGFIVPSASPAEYRANDGTSIAAYIALFDHVTSLENNSWEMVNIPVLCYIDPKDELVSIAAIEKIIGDKKLNNWKLTVVPSKRPTPYHHIIIDKTTLGKELWTRYTNEIKHFLQN